MSGLNVKEFLATASFTPLAKAARAKTFLLVFTWIVILILAISVTCYQVSGLIAKLQAGNKIARPSIVDSNELKFPAVTFCNLNPYKSSAVSSLEIFAVLKNISDTVSQGNKGKYFYNDYQTTAVVQNEKRVRKRSPNQGCAAIDTKQKYHVKNYQTGFYMDFSMSFGYINQFVGLYYPDLSQTWVFYPEKSQTVPQYFYIVQNKSGKALTMQSDGKLVLSNAFCNATEQLFLVEANISDCSRKRILISNVYLTSSSDNQNASIVLSAYQDPTQTVTRQEWVLESSATENFTFACTKSPCDPDPNKFYKIYSNITQLVLEVENGSMAAWSSIILNTDINETNQHWSFQVLYNPIRYLVVNRRSNLGMFSNDSHMMYQQYNQGNSTVYLLINDNGMCLLNVYQTDKYITNHNYWTFPGAPVVFWYYNPFSFDAQGAGQRFSFVEVINATNSNELSTISPQTTPAIITTTTSTTLPQTTTTKYNIMSTIFNISISNPPTSVDHSSTTKSINIFNKIIESVKPEDVIKVLNLQLNTDVTSQQTTLQAALAYMLSNLNEEQRMSLGFQTSDVMQYCSFNGRKCDELDITQWNDMISGNCFTFNHKTSPKQHFGYHAGHQYGLKILFNVMSNEYLPMTMSSGVKIFIHDQNTTIFTDVEGDVVSGSYAADFSVVYREIHKKTKDCVKETNSNINFYDGDYSYESCIRTCYQLRIIDKCGCADPGIAIQKSIPQLQRFCGTNEMPCVQYVYESNVTEKLNCSLCQLPCDEKLFEYTKTVSKLKLNFNKNQSLKEAIAVDVFYRSLSYVILDDNYEYTIDDFLGDLGGILGMYLGVTCITVFEFAFLLVVFASRCVMPF